MNEKAASDNRDQKTSDEDRVITATLEQVQTAIEAYRREEIDHSELATVVGRYRTGKALGSHTLLSANASEVESGDRPHSFESGVSTGYIDTTDTTD